MVRAETKSPTASQDAGSWTATSASRWFPHANFHGVKWPYLENILNGPPFCAFRNWLVERNQVADGPLGPTTLPRAGVIVFQAGMADRSGAGAKRTSMGPVVPFNLSPSQSATTARNHLLLPHHHPLQEEVHLVDQGVGERGGSRPRTLILRQRIGQVGCICSKIDPLWL